MQIQIVVDGQTVALASLTPKTFSTGSRGYNVNTKAEINGKRYQITGNLVEIGSKPH